MNLIERMSKFWIKKDFCLRLISEMLHIRLQKNSLNLQSNTEFLVSWNSIFTQKTLTDLIKFVIFPPMFSIYSSLILITFEQTASCVYSQNNNRVTLLLLLIV